MIIKDQQLIALGNQNARGQQKQHKHQSQGQGSSCLEQEVVNAPLSDPTDEDKELLAHAEHTNEQVRVRNRQPSAKRQASTVAASSAASAASTANEEASKRAKHS